MTTLRNHTVGRPPALCVFPSPLSSLLFHFTARVQSSSLTAGGHTAVCVCVWRKNPSEIQAVKYDFKGLI